MKMRALLALAGCLLAVRLCAQDSAPKPKAAASPFNEMDQLIGQASALVVDLEKYVSHSAQIWPKLDVAVPQAAVTTSTAAPKQTSQLPPLPDIPGDARKKFVNQCNTGILSVLQSRFAAGPIMPSDLAWEPLAENYYHCVAFMERNPDRCAALKAVHFGYDRTGNRATSADTTADVSKEVPDRGCRLDYEFMALTQAFVSKAPDALARCEEMYQKRGFSRGRELCSILTQGSDIQADCAKALPLLNSVPGRAGTAENEQMTQPDCVKWLSKVRGEGGVSSKFGVAMAEAYRKSLETKNAGVCGQVHPFDPLQRQNCRFMLGLDGKHCEARLDAVRSVFCGPWVEARMAQEKPALDKQVAEQRAAWEEKKRQRDEELKAAARRELQARELEAAALRKQEERVAAERMKMAKAGHSAGASKKAEVVEGLGQKAARLKPLMARLDMLVEGFQPKNLPAFQSRREKVFALHKRVELSMKRFNDATEE